jgi:hypothetical protein
VEAIPTPKNHQDHRSTAFFRGHSEVYTVFALHLRDADLCVRVSVWGGTLFHTRVHCPLFLSALLYLVINHNLSE